MTSALTPSDALRRLGFDLNRPQRGRIMIQTDTCRFKYYAFRYRVGDGHIITRLGRVVSAKEMGHGIVTFRVEGL